MIIHIQFILSILAAWAFGFNEPEQIVQWSFNRQDALVTRESVSGQLFTIFSNFENPEYVRGIDGTGLRLDGYSSYVKGELPVRLPESFSLGGWYALETYPTDTAGFFTLADQSGNQWISAEVDLFGRILIGQTDQGIENYQPGQEIIEKFEWNQVLLTVDQDKAILYLNGNRLATLSLGNNFSSQLSEVILGRSYRDKHLYNYFPVSHLNGIMDEVSLWNQALTAEQVKNLYKTRGPGQKPDLAIPAVRFQDDFNRPKYHLLPAANWTNETHGLIHYQDRYHIFNQKNGTNLYLGQINWGHFSSPDLIHWTEHQPVLTPEPEYDRMGIWSGHAFMDEQGQPVIMYTGNDGQTFGMNLAFPRDENLINWQKYEGNPVVKGPPAHFERIDFRDPIVWQEDDTWYMIIGFGLVEEGIEKGTVLLYRSDNLKDWKYLHPLFTGDPEQDDSGVFWEMPVFRKMGDKYILLVNKVPHQGNPAVALYWTGDFKEEKFVPDDLQPKRLEVINRFLSPSVTKDASGQTVAIGIIPDETHPQAQLNQGWTHLYSIPRVWQLKGNKITQQPLPALTSLRYAENNIQPQEVKPGKSISLARGDHQLEIYLELIPEGNQFGLILGMSPDRREMTRLYYNFDQEEWTVDRTQSSQRPFIPLDTRSGKYKLKKNEKVSLRLFIDGSVIEGFINDEDAFTTRIFPQSPLSNQVELFSQEGSVQLLEAKVWKMKSSNNQVVW
ncbi:MAG: GH32 C-terminal domain-containing protein [Candidatus Cyclobacteriaceae bacterium M3_2C_046]